MNLTTALEIRKRRPVIDYEPYPAICYLSGSSPFHVERCLGQQKGLDLPELLISFLKTSGVIGMVLLGSRGRCGAAIGAGAGVNARRASPGPPHRQRLAK